jgi:hypothetical protein
MRCDEPLQSSRSHGIPRHALLFLIVPWTVLVPIAIGQASGFANKIADTVPNGMGRFAWDHVWIGLTSVFVICSVLFSKVNHRHSRKDGAELVVDTLALGLALAVAQLSVAFGILFAIPGR